MLQMYRINMSSSAQQRHRISCSHPSSNECMASF